jgi:hypothetical protein
MTNSKFSTSSVAATSLMLGQERPTVAKVLDREEAEWARFGREKDFPPGFFPTFQVGGAPAAGGLSTHVHPARES